MGSYWLHKKLKPQKVKTTNRNVENSGLLHDDTFSLKLNYDDPFLKRNSRNTSYSSQNVTSNSSAKKTSTNPKKDKSVKPKKWPVIQYHGYAKKEGETVFLAITVNREGRIIKSHEPFDDVQIQSFSEDQIICLFKGEEKVFEAK